MPKPRINPGDRYGKVVVKSRAENSDQGKSRWNCTCDCGKPALLLAATLTTNPNPSCGCDIQARRPHWNRSHGHSSDRKASSTYSAWTSMRQRCSNPMHVSYENYSGKGIRVCEAWDDFEKFLADMGERPEGMTLERRKVEVGYQPDNCVWADKETQANNRRGQKFYLVDDRWLTRAQASRHWGITEDRAKTKLRDYPMKENPK